MCNNKDRKFNAYTGKLGAIQFEISLREYAAQLDGVKLTENIKNNIKNKVNNMEWKDGCYKISSEEGLKYLGND